MTKRRAGESGFTLVELTVSMVIISIVVVAFFGLFISLVRSTVIAKRRAVALTLATNQMEYLKSLPYDSLAVQGGSIVATTLLPATATPTINGVKYTVTTSISYVDDAYDGCGNYPDLATKQAYCRNYPPPAAAPSLDANPADYKIVNVTVTDTSGARLAYVDTQVSARVSETASTTGALFVTVIDPSGAPVSGATVTVTNTTTSPNVSVGDSTDTNGTSIFYGLPPDSGADYTITATKSGYSSITTIGASGSLQATYPKQSILTQQASFVTLKIAQMGTNSLVIETTNTSGTALPGVAVYVKGGYKKYTLTSDTGYYYDNYSPTNNRPTTDASGLAALQNLPPLNSYTFCGDDGSAHCTIGGVTYYLAAAVPYGGGNPLGPIAVPEYNPSNPPTTTFSYGGNEYLQKVRLMLTTNANLPRVFTMTPTSVSLSGGNLNNTVIVINGANLSSASASFSQGANTFPGTSCTASTNQLSCTYDLSAATTGPLALTVTNGAGSLSLPTTPLGGLDVIP
ncbi:carboxypeptidase regulatory-like domain-containing protein [Candidatus Saccharibacteria bacterium]|nr:carboxypeptidase regulatory-like domain-containing protein [Candidatus Saccharibacteria bacterium]